MAYDKSRQFISAFIDIENALGKIVKNKKYIPFYQLVDQAAQKDPYVRDIAIELKEYGDLRNAIVHERINNQPIAEPHEEVVLRLQKIRDLMMRPPKVEDKFIREVVTCKSDDLLSDAIAKMLENSFSKLPVYKEKVVGLLTAEAVTYWLADHIMKSDSLKHERVKAVLEYNDKRTNYSFVSPKCSLFKILRIFDQSSYQGQRMQAILITSDGTKSGELLGIITIFDLPLIYNIIEG